MQKLYDDFMKTARNLKMVGELGELGSSVITRSVQEVLPVMMRRAHKPSLAQHVYFIGLKALQTRQAHPTEAADKLYSKVRFVRGNEGVNPVASSLGRCQET